VSHSFCPSKSDPWPNHAIRSPARSIRRKQHQWPRTPYRVWSSFPSIQFIHMRSHPNSGACPPRHSCKAATPRKFKRTVEGMIEWCLSVTTIHQQWMHHWWRYSCSLTKPIEERAQLMDGETGQ
jgi:hypothetical protein